jgi:tRNA(Ile)-lysidine synthase
MHVLCDADALGGSLTVRSRRPGDRLHPLGLDGTRKLQDIMVDRHVPRGERDRIPVVTNAEHVVWVPGLALDGRVAISGETTRVAHLRFRLDGPDYRDTMIHSF